MNMRFDRFCNWFEKHIATHPTIFAIAALLIYLTIIVAGFGVVISLVNDRFDNIKNENNKTLEDVDLVETTSELEGSEFYKNKDIMDMISIVLYEKHNEPKDDFSKNTREWYKGLTYKSYWNNKTEWLIDFNSYLMLVNYWSNYIPRSFLYPLINECLKQDVEIAYIYAICMKESSFKYMVSNTHNSNGTKDYGVMGLNECNFRDYKWLKSCFYFDGEYNELIQFDVENQRHVLKAGIKHFKDCYILAGNDLKDAAIIYNCGIGNYIRNTIPESSMRYGAEVINMVNMLTEQPTSYGYSRLQIKNCCDMLGITVSELN